MAEQAPEVAQVAAEDLGLDGAVRPHHVDDGGLVRAHQVHVGRVGRHHVHHARRPVVGRVVLVVEDRRQNAQRQLGLGQRQRGRGHLRHPDRLRQVLLGIAHPAAAQPVHPTSRPVRRAVGLRQFVDPGHAVAVRASRPLQHHLQTLSLRHDEGPGVETGHALLALPLHHPPIGHLARFLRPALAAFTRLAGRLVRLGRLRFRLLRLFGLGRLRFVFVELQFFSGAFGLGLLRSAGRGFAAGRHSRRRFGGHGFSCLLG